VIATCIFGSIFSEYFQSDVVWIVHGFLPIWVAMMEKLVRNSEKKFEV